MLEQPTSVPHTLSHTSGTTQPTSSTGEGNAHTHVRKDLYTLQALCLIVSTDPQTWVENPADHPWEHHEEHGQQFQVATHDAAGLDVGQTASCKTPLDDHLQTNKTSRRVIDVQFLICVGFSRTRVMTAFTWSEHQYQTPNIAIPNTTPGQGRSPPLASLSRLKASWRGV